MSIKALRIVHIEYAPAATFDCERDAKLMDFLLKARGTYDRLDYGDEGMIEVPVEALQAALADRNLKLETEVRECLRADITSAIKVGDNYIKYSCFEND